MKDDALYIHYIHECLLKIDAYIEGKSKENFLQDSMLQDAVIRNLQVLSESTQRLSEETKLEYSQIEWFKISGFRNILVHGYLQIDLERVWLIIVKDLPDLQQTIKTMLEQ